MVHIISLSHRYEMHFNSGTLKNVYVGPDLLACLNFTLRSIYPTPLMFPTPSKIGQGIIQQQLIGHIEDESFLSDFQFGFRQERSTLHAVKQLVKHGSEGFAKGAVTVTLC